MNHNDNIKDRGSARRNRLGMGVALGVAIGVALSVALDNWGMIGVGIAVGLLFGGMPLFGRRSQDGSSHASGTPVQDDRE